MPTWHAYGVAPSTWHHQFMSTTSEGCHHTVCAAPMIHTGGTSMAAKSGFYRSLLTNSCQCGAPDGPPRYLEGILGLLPWCQDQHNAARSQCKIQLKALSQPCHLDLACGIHKQPWRALVKTLLHCRTCVDVQRHIPFDSQHTSFTPTVRPPSRGAEILCPTHHTGAPDRGPDSVCPSARSGFLIPA